MHDTTDDAGAAGFGLSPFRRSIWTETLDYRLHDASKEQLNHVVRIYNLMAAKLNIAFPTPAVCTSLIEAIGKLPDDPTVVSSEELVEMLVLYLDAVKSDSMRGIGIHTAMCGLAVEKGDRYAPSDRKIARGLQNLKILTSAEAKLLASSTSHRKYAHVYVHKVLPAWHKERQQKSARQVDEYWASQTSVARLP